MSLIYGKYTFLGHVVSCVLGKIIQVEFGRIALDVPRRIKRLIKR